MESFPMWWRCWHFCLIFLPGPFPLLQPMFHSCPINFWLWVFKRQEKGGGGLPEAWHLLSEPSVAGVGMGAGGVSGMWHRAGLGGSRRQPLQHALQCIPTPHTMADGFSPISMDGLHGDEVPLLCPTLFPTCSSLGCG